MILSVNPINAMTKMHSNAVKKHSVKETEVVTNPNADELLGVPRSYISFKAAEGEKSIQFTDEAKILLNQAMQIAVNYGHEELLPAHIIQASIELTEDNLAQIPTEALDSGVIDSVSPLSKIVNDKANQNMLVSPLSREYFLDMLEDLKSDNEEFLANLPKEENIDASQIVIEEDLEKALKETETQARTINPYVLLGVAMNSMTNRGITYPSEFLKGAISYGLYKGEQDIQVNYMQEYDTRAIDVWNKLALGSNLNITYEDPKEADRLVASIVNTLDAKKYGNFNSKNTMVFAISDDIVDVQLYDEIVAQKEANPDVQKIFLINMDKLLASTVNATGEISYSNGIIQALKESDDNLKIVFLQSNDVFYSMVEDKTLKSMYSNFVTYPIPPIQTYEASEIIDDDFLEVMPTPYTKEAKERAIYHAANMSGIFPDKAVDLMKRVAVYYGDAKKEITGSDVDEFAQIAHELFNKKSSSKTNIVYDTDKTLDTMYGKETVKKDIEAIIRQIKTGKIGTRGMIIYSQDLEAGSGRMHTAETIAGEAKVPFVAIDTSDFAVSERDSEGVSVETPKNAMRRVFSEAKKAARQNQYKTAVIFINNFEEFAFSGPYLPGYKQAMSQLSKEMQDAVNEDVSILVIGSTDEYYAEAIPAVVRGFNQSLVVDSPANNKRAREEILVNKINEAALPLACANEAEKASLIKKLVKLSEHMSFVELKSMVDKTKQIMYERGKDKASTGDFIEAYLQLATGRTSHPEMPSFNKEATTSHECGHATNLEVMNDILRRRGKPWHKSYDVNFITLDPRGDFLGAVFEGKEDNTDYPFEAMFTGLVCSFGGYSCEKMFFGMDGSAVIGMDLAQATSAAKRGVEYFGLGYNTGKISNAAQLKSQAFYESVYKDIDVILTNAQVASDMITECYRGFNEWFTQKFSKLIGTDDCMVDGDDFRKALNKWKKSLSADKKEEISIMEEIVMDLIQSAKNGKKYKLPKKIL